MPPKTRRNASLDTIQRRLEAREKDLNRQLENALRRGGYDLETFFSSTVEEHNDPEHTSISAQVEAEIARGGLSWEELSRPDVEDLRLDPRIQMLRV
ncbi:MAG: hypothetical protein KAI47_05030 [Deltaproteobacteria bacterium]|nr:hypothetical protein [Deltaproteobacteria bacterium]